MEKMLQVLTLVLPIGAVEGLTGPESEIGQTRHLGQHRQQSRRKENTLQVLLLIDVNHSHNDTKKTP